MALLRRSAQDKKRKAGKPHDFKHCGSLLAFLAPGQRKLHRFLAQGGRVAPENEEEEKA